jgi:hypothetical protein
MSIELTSADFDRVVGMLSTMPDFRTVQSRVDFMTDVFAEANAGSMCFGRSTQRPGGRLRGGLAR